jgi:hypothetical protein
MSYKIETYDAGLLVATLPVDGTEEQAIERAKALRTPENINFIRITDSNSGGIEIWSERRDA